MPTAAEEFEAEMRRIWDDDPEELYDEWHNANERAQHPKWSASDTGRIEDDWAEWEFGDGSKLWILKDGNGTVGAP
jgi:hypothetical protein